MINTEPYQTPLAECKTIKLHGVHFHMQAPNSWVILELDDIGPFPTMGKAIAYILTPKVKS